MIAVIEKSHLRKALAQFDNTNYTVVKRKVENLIELLITEHNWIYLKKSNGYGNFLIEFNDNGVRTATLTVSRDGVIRVLLSESYFS